MPKPLHARIATLLLAIAFAQTAAETGAPTLMEEVIVTATRTEESVFETPFTAHVIARERFLDERDVRVGRSLRRQDFAADEKRRKLIGQSGAGVGHRQKQTGG